MRYDANRNLYIVLMLGKKPSQKYSEIEEKMFYGDPAALRELLRIMNDNGTSEKDGEAAFDSFEAASIGYAMGIQIKPEESEWNMFREIVKYSSMLNDNEEGLVRAEDAVKRMKFEETVLRIMERHNDDIDREFLSSELDGTRSGIECLQTEIEESTKQRDFCSAWLTIARAQLHHSRFTALSEDEFYELVDSVSSVLSEDDDEDDDEE